MTLANPLITHAAIGVACAIGGFLMGRAERTVQAGKPARQRWAALGKAVVALTLVGLAVYLVYARDQQNACYESYFSGISQSLAERSAATGAASMSLRSFLVTIDDVGAVDLAARDSYVAALDQQENARRAAPLPVPPGCG